MNELHVSSDFVLHSFQLPLVIQAIVILILLNQKPIVTDGGTDLQFQLLMRLAQEDHKFTDIGNKSRL